MELTPFSVFEILGGEWLNMPEERMLHKNISEISIDSRSLSHDALFFALEGERFDGHDFILDVFKKGALAAVVSKPLCLRQIKGGIIKVSDTLQGLQRLASVWRERHTCNVIAVTGSSGKTTTKELIASILSQKFDCLSTEGNMNNHIGVPITLLRIKDLHSVAVIELGMNHKGEIAHLTSMVKPSIGIITNVGKAHIGFLGSVDKVLEAKAELLDGMGPNDTAILNRDDPYFYILAERCKNGIITVGESPDADFRIDTIKMLPEDGRTEVGFSIQGESFLVSLPILGRFVAYNLLMAVAVAIELGCGRKEIEEGIAKFVPIPGRITHHMIKGIHILDDSYNANPESMHSALKTLFECKGSGRSLAILGDMMELGSQSECLHRQLGQWLGHKNGVDFLITCGPQAQMIGQEAMKRGYPAQMVWSLNDHEEISSLASSLLYPGDWVLIKGSRKMRLDIVFKRLVELIDLRNHAKRIDNAHNDSAVRKHS